MLQAKFARLFGGGMGGGGGGKEHRNIHPVSKNRI